MVDMDIDATPFGTDDALASDRRRHRELLAAVPNWILDTMRPPPLDDPFGASPRKGLWERRLRVIADKQLEPVMALLERAKAGAEVEEVEAILLQTTNGDDMLWVLDEVMTDLRSQKSQYRIPREYNDEDHGGAMRRAIALLAWADELANDGYRDPRFDVDDSLT